MTEQEVHPCDLCKESSPQVTKVTRHMSDLGDNPHYLCAQCRAWEDAFYNLIEEIDALQTRVTMIRGKASALMDELSKRCGSEAINFYQEEFAQRDGALDAHPKPFERR
jgi:hypothetical protein